jgi:hypothetical protein
MSRPFLVLLAGTGDIMTRWILYRFAGKPAAPAAL